MAYIPTRGNLSSIGPDWDHRGNLTGPAGPTIYPIGPGADAFHIMDWMKGKHTTTSLSYPLNVEGDSQLGHYIMFFVSVVDEGKLATIESKRDIRRAAAADREAADAVRQSWSGHKSSEDKAFVDAGGVSNSILLRNRPVKRLTGAISLYMPPNITVNYESKWADGEVGIVAQTGYEAIKGFMDRGWAGKSETVKGTLDNLDHVLRQGAIGMLDAVAPGAKTLFAIERGRVITPKMEMMFEGIGRRNFSYVFTFIPKSAKEANAVHNIVRNFKYHMAANYAGGGQFAQREMEIPSMFEIQYMYKAKENENLNKIGTCVLTKMDVEYGGDKYVSHEGGVPQTTKLTLNFTELETITKDHIAEGF